MSEQFKGLLLALVGIVILSPDTLLVRMLDLPQWTMQFYRGAGVLVGLTVIMACIHGRNVGQSFLAMGWVGVAAGFSYAMSSLLFVSSLYHTTVANTLAIISTAPVWSALLTRFVLKVKLPRRTWFAVVLSFLAIVIIVGADIKAGSQHLLGDVFALLQAIFMAISFVLVRSRKEVNMIPCTAISGLFMCLIALLFSPVLTVEAARLPLLGVLVLCVIPVSFGMLILAPRYISAPEVNMIMLLEMIFGPILVWLVVGEKIPGATLIGGGLLFTVLLCHSLLSMRQRGRPL